MEDSSTSFMKVDVRGEPHCRAKRFHRKARRVSERASERAVDMSAYYGQAAFIRQKRTFKGGGEIVNSISWKEPQLRHPFNIFQHFFTGNCGAVSRADIVFSHESRYPSCHAPAAWVTINLRRKAA